MLWIADFLGNRTTTLRLQEGDIGNREVATGIPQGSPLSLILYLFFNADLITDLQKASAKVLVIGYIDDICIITWGEDRERNCRRIERLHLAAEG